MHWVDAVIPDGAILKFNVFNYCHKINLTKNYDAISPPPFKFVHKNKIKNYLSNQIHKVLY
jgi:hypothetical protein